MLPIAGLCAIATSRFVTNQLGPDGFAIFALVASVPLLFPVADLGFGAALTNSAAGLIHGSQSFASNYHHARKALLLVATGLSVLALLIAIPNLWPSLLGIEGSRDLNWGIAVAMCVFAWSVPVSIGNRILVGLRRGSLAIALQSAAPIFSLGTISILLALGGGIGWAVAGCTAGTGIAAIASWFAAMRDPRVRRALRTPPGSRARELGSTARSMLVISVALPLTLQSDRLVLGWSSDVMQLGIYSAAAMAFLPVLSVVQATTQALWGEFAHVRESGGDQHRLFWRSFAISTLLGVAGGCAVWLLGPFVARVATDSQIETPWKLYGTFGMLVLVQAVHAPSGMYLTDPDGLKFQARTCSAMAAFSLAGSLALAPPLGAYGPVIATIGSFGLAQALPCYLRARQLLAQDSVSPTIDDRIEASKQ